MKCTSAIRQLAYDAVPNALDEYLQMGKATARVALKLLVKLPEKLCIALRATINEDKGILDEKSSLSSALCRTRVLEFTPIESHSAKNYKLRRFGLLNV
ncbi:hypothetical protein Tco_0688674 [Tanacetum coccineum]